jgi:hypothetical protein
MNWGYKIALVYIIFVLGICFMVFKTTQVKTDLVTSDYYGAELKYQDKLDQSKRAAALSEPLRIEAKERNVIVTFPKDFKDKKKEGSVLLYCPSNENKDLAVNINTASDQLIVPLSSVAKGWYEAKITYKVAGVDYYFEKKILL